MSQAKCLPYRALRLESKSTALAVLMMIACATIAGQSGEWGPPEGAKPTYSLVYTGRLFGYFRYPDEQTTNETGCPAFNESLAPRQVQEFRSALMRIRDENKSTQVLVSMGDNFAPELLARAMRNEEKNGRYFGQMVMKDAFTSDANGKHWYSDFDHVSVSVSDSLMRGRVPSDNVACFMRLAGIEAVVPGQEDFYFGPERLRELARFLAEPAGGAYQPVQMLAANLSIQTTPHSPSSPLPIETLRKPLQEALKTSTTNNIDLPKSVMPWLQTLAVTISDPIEKVYDCLASADNPRDFKLPFESGNECEQLRVVGEKTYSLPEPRHRSANFLPYYKLEPGTNHALCVTYKNHGKDAVSCKTFSVEYPLLQDRPASSGTTPAPYYISTSGTIKIAVFGVMDQSLAGYIGQFNYSYLNLNSKFDTKIKIADPIEALRQMLQLCGADEHCKGARKILLAQMPFYKASQLATKIDGFDVVVAEADREHATGVENSSRSVTERRHPYVLTPGLDFNGSRAAALSVNLRTATLYAPDGERELPAREYLATRVYDTPVEPPAARTPDARRLERSVSTAVGNTGGVGAIKNYEELALSSMQTFCRSDVALLQHRDIFSEFQKAIAYWPASHAYGVQQLLDEVLWKGDFSFCLPLRGSTLKKVLSDSAAFDQQDRDNLSLETEVGRGLSTLGITMDSGSGPPMIRNQPIADDKLYGVAMSDFLAFGDTGYPELSSEAVPPPVRVTTLSALNRLTGLACAQLSAKSKRPVADDACQTGEMPVRDYFDAIVQKPFDTSAGLDAFQQLRLWGTHPFPTDVTGTTFLSKKQQTPEGQVENRGMWWFTLQNLTAEYDLSFIRGSDKRIPSNFSGINTFSQLSTPESSKIGLWTRVRGGYSFPKFVDFYASGEEKFTNLAVRQSDSTGNGNFGPYQLTLSDNAVRAETGVLSKPISKKIPIRALLSENLFTQVTDPFQQLTVAVPCSSSECTPAATTLKSFYLGKNYLLMSRIGARLENRVSWFEAGREYGESIGIPLSFALQDVGRPEPFSCALAGNLSLTRCISADPLFRADSKILPNLRNQPLAGWFMNFHIAAPIYKSKLQLTIDSYGEKFDKRADDTGFNTRFYEDLTFALNVPLWGNLTFAPQVEAFFFQNKIVPNQTLVTNHYTFVTSSMKLEYGFDWHRGVGIVRALRYPSGVLKAPSAAAPLP